MKLGDMAMELIADAPLYASTSGITYDQAIAVAKALYGKDWVAEYHEIKRFESLSLEEQRKELGL